MLLTAAVATPDFRFGISLSESSSAASPGPVGFAPSVIRHAYGIDQVQFGTVAGDGSGQTIAIIDAYNDPNIAADLHTFDQAFFPGTADPALTVVNEYGSTSGLPRNAPNRGNSWALEISLDVEWAHAVAPKASILLVEANSANDSDLMTAVDTARRTSGVSVVSMSWGGGEAGSQLSEDAYFTSVAGHDGVTFVASSGDSGAGAEYPASSPNVLSVGGTTLHVNGSSYGSESAWNGSGGGLSSVEAEPGYQHGVVPTSITSTRRAVPDVAADADPNSGAAVADSWDFSVAQPWVQVGGTSLSAPIWAGLVALVDQGRALAGKSSFDGATQTLPALYSLYTTNPGDFHDITTGSNGYHAGAGYDLVTGLGTPVANLLVPMLAGYTPAPPAANPMIGSFTVSPTSVTAGATVNLTAGSLSDAGSTITGVAFYRESNGIAGLQTGVGGDTLLGTLATTGAPVTLATSTAGLTAGTYTYYGEASDKAGVNGPVAQATLKVTAVVVGPANDNFAAATVVSGETASATGTNVGATKEAGEPNVAGNKGGASVWYSWTADVSGTVSLDTHGSNFDTLLGVYTGGSVAALSLVASNDDDVAHHTLASAVTFNAVAGTTYHIVVDGYNRGRGAATGQISLNLVQVVAPGTGGSGSAGVTCVIDFGVCLTRVGMNSPSNIIVPWENSSSPLGTRITTIFTMGVFTAEIMGTEVFGIPSTSSNSGAGATPVVGDTNVFSNGGGDLVSSGGAPIVAFTNADIGNAVGVVTTNVVVDGNNGATGNPA